ncbi:PREDICTED: TMV resistance protein N-like [Populus euphratica]|uniref:TMV resistance protein N-like n=1 Tax=Populus euphratica TaxID=75702 RepID=A0AAJ6SYG5_POPEU|nr:PREDICTED: TMV resistance protein N-like [Populus euphratica]
MTIHKNHILIVLNEKTPVTVFFSCFYHYQGKDAVEGLALDVQESFSTKSFTKIKRLKLLKINRAHIVGSYSLLPKELIWLCWFRCPLKSLPSDFHLNDLVILDMQNSNVRKLWKGTKILNRLKILNLSFSKYLAKTPNFRGLSSLERLILAGCRSLVEVHQSIGTLKSLVLLNLEVAYNLRNCQSLGDIESLTELFTKGTAIKQLPPSARYLKKLTKLSFGGYNKVFDSPYLPSKSWFSRFSSWLSPQSCSSSIDVLPASFNSFSSLKELNLSYSGLSEATSSIDLGSLSFLENLNLSGHEFFNLPSSISRLSKLQFLTVERCSNLLSISELPSSVLFLSINDCTSIERVSAPLQPERLPLLDVKGCRNLIEIQGIECAGNNWSILNLNDCNNLSENYKMSFIQGLCKGKHYDICLAGGEIPEWFSHRGDGSSLSFRLPSVSVADGNKLQALLLWVVSASSSNEATDQETSFLQFDMCVATFKNKSNGIELFETMAAVTFDRNSTKHSWIQRISLIGSEELLQGVEELELNVKISFYDVPDVG